MDSKVFREVPGAQEEFVQGFFVPHGPEEAGVAEGGEEVWVTSGHHSGKASWEKKRQGRWVSLT